MCKKGVNKPFLVKRNCLQTLALKLQLDVSAVCTRMILPCWLVKSHRFSVWLFLSGPHDISIGPESNHCLSLSETCFSTWLMWLSLGLILDWCDSGCWRCLLTMLLMLMFVSDTWSKCLSRHILRPQQHKARKDKNRRRIFFSAVPAGREGNRSPVSSHNVVMQFSKWQETGHLLPLSRFHKRCSINSFTKAALSKSLRRANGVSRNRPLKKSRSKEDDKLKFSSKVSCLKIMFLPPAFSKRQWGGAVLQSNETV